ncbi:hypothetical protein [Actinoplanes rectilineatus]|uniref:hypothetical protein n=1 Tax=Actinoplanes rectilineatus TaxID=113571 RepID=UPI0012F8F966|nr:hypothetical protein [Actinoplanes rectilineatus]
MAIVKYAQWRDYGQQRIQTNDTVMGLLAGSKLAAQTLNLTAGSTLTLSQIFPKVEHIARFNLRADRARQVLEEAEILLGILAVPQILALHEDLFQGMSSMLVTEGLMTVGQASGIKTANMHERIQGVIPGAQFTPESLELFHLVRVARNTHIHSGGRADQTLINRIQSVPQGAFEVWDRITGEPFPPYSVGDPVRMGLHELLGILAITKRLAEEANGFLQSALPVSRWADMLVADWIQQRRPGNRAQMIKSALGLSRVNFGAIRFAASDIEDAMIRAGI